MDANAATLAAQPTESNEQLGPQLPASCAPPQPNKQTCQLVWIIFGASGRMGRSIARVALEHGDIVVSVGREREGFYQPRVPSLVSRHLTSVCDVREPTSVANVFSEALKTFGRYDIVANCSGSGIIGSCEDQDEHDLISQFQTNYMGTVNIVLESVKYFRTQAAGRYLIFSSIGGALSVPGLGPYYATKYAVEGFVEALLYEMSPFNVKTTIVAPGFVRHDDMAAGGSNEVASTWNHFKTKMPSEPYSHASSPALHPRRLIRWLGDKQPTSAAKSAELVWQLGHCKYPPLRLLLGSCAVDSIRDRLRFIAMDLEEWKHIHFPVPDDQASKQASYSATGMSNSAPPLTNKVK